MDKYNGSSKDRLSTHSILPENEFSRENRSASINYLNYTSQMEDKHKYQIESL